MTGAGFAAIVVRSACLGFLLISTLDAAFAVDSNDKEKAGDCLKSPKGATPPGERWFYRVERGTKRHCWYTRADAPRKAVAQRTPPPKPIDNPAKGDAPPLQLSVANARAEADLSATPPPAPEPRDTPPVQETRNPAWTLAERWSQNSDATPVPQSPQAQSQPAPIARPAAPLRIDPPEPIDDAGQDSLRDMAAGAVALLGLSMVLTATLVRRRRATRPLRSWPPASSHDDDSEPEKPLTDLNEAPLMTWRKTPKDRLQTLRRAAELRDATSVRIKPSPAGSAGFRRTPTIPPGARA